MRLALCLAALAVLAGCGGSSGTEMTVSMAEQSGSKQSGDVVLTEVDGSTTRVEISIGSGGDTPQPAHIHKGSCAKLDPEPAYALDDVVAGQSSTEVDVSLDKLRDGEFAVNVHKSVPEAAVYVACGDIASGGGARTETGSDGYGY